MSGGQRASSRSARRQLFSGSNSSASIRQALTTRWCALVHNQHPDFSEKGGGGKEPPAQEKVKLAKYGFHFARAFSRLLADDLISELNLYRASGLKPKYQRAYFDYVKSLSADDSEIWSLTMAKEPSWIAPASSTRVGFTL